MQSWPSWLCWLECCSVTEKLQVWFLVRGTYGRQPVDVSSLLFSLSKMQWKKVSSGEGKKQWKYDACWHKLCFVYWNKMLSWVLQHFLIMLSKNKILKNIFSYLYNKNKWFSVNCVWLCRSYWEFFILIICSGLQFLCLSLLKCWVFEIRVCTLIKTCWKKESWQEYGPFLYLVNNTWRRKKYFHVRG